MPTACVQSATEHPRRPTEQPRGRWNPSSGDSPAAPRRAAVKTAAHHQRRRVDAAGAGRLAAMVRVGADDRRPVAGPGPLRSDRTPGARDVA